MKSTKKFQIQKSYKFCPQCANKLTRKFIESKKRLYCNKCHFVFWKNPKPCVSVILAKNKKILLLKRAYDPFKNYWCLPGGYVEYEETPESAIIRETKEETNLDIKINNINKLIGVYQIDNDPRSISIDIIYLGSIVNGQLRLTKAHSKYRFFTFGDLPRLIAYKHREAIYDYKTYYL